MGSRHLQQQHLLDTRIKGLYSYFRFNKSFNLEHQPVRPGNKFL